MAKLDWTKARKDRPSTDTGATRKLEHRAERWLEVVEENQRKLHECKQGAAKTTRRRR